MLTYMRELNMASMMLRILLAMLVGGVIGLDRERKGRAAGFRTYMLVAMGAAITMILSQYLDLMLSTFWVDSYNVVGRKTDVVRLGARVISGIGFIGTGTILVTARHEVKGLTTASGLWASACIGIAVGAGFYECVLVSFVLMLLCIKLLPAIERSVMSNARNMNIYVEMDSIENVSEIVGKMKAADYTIYDVEISRETKNNVTAQISGLFLIRLPRKEHHTEVLARLGAVDGIVSIEEV